MLFDSFDVSHIALLDLFEYNALKIEAECELADEFITLIDKLN